METVTLNVIIRICPILHGRENKVSASISNFEEKQIKNTTNNEKPSDRPPETSRERKYKIPDDQKQNQKKRIRIRIVSWLCRGRFVPSSHKGSEFRYAIVRQFSRGGVIPVPDSFGKEAFDRFSYRPLY